MRRAKVGRSESEVLRFIADRGSASVSEVADYLSETKGQTRNTAQSMMERLRTKGFLTREKSDAVFVYSPSETKSNMLDGIVEEFVDGVLGGSVTPLVTFLGHRTEVTESELDALKALVRQLEERA